jgi:hypothetical protein
MFLALPITWHAQRQHRTGVLFHLSNVGFVCKIERKAAQRNRPYFANTREAIERLNAQDHRRRHTLMMRAIGIQA